MQETLLPSPDDARVEAGNGLALDNFERGEWTADSHAVQALPRADGGKDAWLFLTACFMLEAVTWGASL